MSWWFHQQQWWFSTWFKQQEWCLFSRVLIGILCGSTSPNGRTFVGELSFIVHLYTTQCDTLIHTCSDTYACIWLYIYIIYTYSNINRYIIVISSYIYIYIYYTHCMCSVQNHLSSTGWSIGFSCLAIIPVLYWIVEPHTVIN